MQELIPTPTPSPPSSLLPHAIAALSAATAVVPGDGKVLVEERSVWQPGSWLIQRCWETLADAGAAEEALVIARLAAMRHPLAPLQALHRLARQVSDHYQFIALINGELDRQRHTLFHATQTEEQPLLSERLLLVAATAALAGDLPLACACLERLDQFEKPWDRVLVRSDLRSLLAESLAHIGAHPLTNSLIAGVIRRFDDHGVQLVHDTAALIAEQGDAAPRRRRKLLQRCVDTFRYSALTSLLGRRLAATTLGRAGLVEEVLSQLALIANVQDARREAGLSSLRDETLLLRQVKRPAASADVDFQVYTLQQAVAAMPVRQLAREKRILLADQLAFLGVRSDGWTAAGAATTLIDLGALLYAVEVVDHINENDPTRVEGMLTLVRGLLTVGEEQMAAEQARRALAWARARPDRNPERAIIWGLAELYLQHGQPQPALQWLAQWRENTGWRHRLSTLWRKQLDDDELRLNALRFRAQLQLGIDRTGSLRLLDQLRSWSPRLLEGEALVNFMLDNLVRPLVAAGWQSEAWTLLPELAQTLSLTSGNRHSAQVAALAGLLTQQLRRARLATSEHALTNGAETGNGQPNLGLESIPDQSLWETAERVLADLWKADARRGAWQAVHGLEGSLPLILALEGPATLVSLARTVYERPWLWTQ
ncbi:MAG TPA: hypothetical protein PKE45_02265 [Caldilineaceae bacterium]|nr:hypothetical protein [Caldilineaceae bacterium]